MTAVSDKSGETLLRLQSLQREFDGSRGFDFGKALERAAESKLAPILLLQFSALALCGETGELANSVKKAVRAQMLDQPSADYREKASDELGDILAYLLKTANLLNENLGVRYLRQMCENALRFPGTKVRANSVVTIAGPSGAGKSTLIVALKKRLPALKTYVEDVSKNAYLAGALAGQSSSVARSQEWFLSQQEAFLRGIGANEAVVMDQDPAAIALVYGHEFWERNEVELGVYESLLVRLLEFEIRESATLGHRFTVFLDAPADVLSKRARPPRSAKSSDSWFENLRARFHELQKKTPRSVLIDTNEHSGEQVMDIVAPLITQQARIGTA